MSKTTLVKKRLATGEPCAKCVQAEQMLKDRGLWDRITEVVWADETDPSSPGMRLAEQYGVTLAPFFLFEDAVGGTAVVTSTLKAIRQLEKLQAEPEPPQAGSAASSGEVGAWAQALANASPASIVEHALKRFGADCWLAFSGAEDVAVIDLAKATGLPFSVFCLDTGRLHAETYRFIDRVRQHYGLDLAVMTPERSQLEPFIRRKGLFSFYEDGHSECCGIRKVEPLSRALSGAQAWMTGQRADQSPATRGGLKPVEVDTRFSGSADVLVKYNPLAGWSSAQVWEYIREQRVPYNALHDRGFISIGCEPCTRPHRPGEHERAARWWWEDSTKRECGLHIAQDS